MSLGRLVRRDEYARRVGVSANSVRVWRARFNEKGLAEFGRIAPGRGRKSWLPEGTVAAVVSDTLQCRPDDGSTHWTTRTMAARHGIGKDSVARIWRDHGLKPWKMETFKVSNDPHFEDKLVDVVGLYLDPPQRAVSSASTKRPSARPWTAPSGRCLCARGGPGP